MILFTSILLSILSFGFKGDKPELAAVLIPSELLKNAHTVVRSSDVIYDIQSPKVYVETVRETVTVLSTKSRYDMLRIHYDKYSKARLIEANVYDAYGKLVRKIKKDQVRDQSAFDGFSLYNDSRFLIIDMDYQTVPFTVEYAYEVTNSQTMNYSDWRPQTYGESVQKASFTIKAAPGITLLTEVINGREIAFADTSLTSQWTVEGLTATKREEDCPPYFTVFPSVVVSPYKFQVEGYKGSMKNWRVFGQFIYDINDQDSHLSPKLNAQLDKMLTGVTEPTEKITILYDYLKDNMRYVSVQLGIGGWRAFDVEHVEDNKYGDCKALTFFMKALLEHAEIESYPVLIASGKEALVIKNFAAPYFNHMILYVPSEDMWLECTSNDNPAGYIGAGNASKDVLLITPDGGKKAKTPSTPLTERLRSSRDSFYLVGDTWHVSSKREFRGADHEICRSIEYYLAPSEQEEFLTKNYDLSISSVNALSFESSKSEDYATCAYELSISHFGSKSGPRYFIPLVPLYRLDKSCATTDRQTDVFIDEPTVVNSNTSIAIPEGYVVENIPDELDITVKDIGAYHISTQVFEHRIEVSRSLKIEKVMLPVDQYSRLCDFYDEINRRDKAKIVLKKG